VLRVCNTAGAAAYSCTCQNQDCSCSSTHFYQHMPKALNAIPWKCPGFGYSQSRHKTRHMRSCKLLARQADPRYAKNVSTMLMLYGLSGILDEWGIELLDKLPNLRTDTPRLVTQHTPWHIHCPEDLIKLPSGGDVLQKVTESLKKKKFTGQIYQGTEVLDASPEVITEFAPNMRNNEEDTRRILNLGSADSIGPQEASAFRQRVLPIFSKFHDLREDINPLTQLHDGMNITPRGTRTEIHHDDLPHISITIGMRSADEKVPLKLWIIWPSTQIAGFGRIGTTAEGVQNLEHGAFLVQMPGELILAPANAPHAVIALHPSYLYGVSVGGTGLLDPTTLLASERGDKNVEDACKLVLEGLELGLASRDWRRRVMQQFVEQWGVEGQEFAQHGYGPTLLRILQDDFETKGQCVWCVSGERAVTSHGKRQHMKKHCGFKGELGSSPS
jgi:hypothetical protein